MLFSLFGAPLRQVFGFDLADKKKKVTSSGVPVTHQHSSPAKHASFISPDYQDGSVVYEYGSGSQVGLASFEETFLAENDLINRFRRMALYPECDMAIDDVINSMVVSEKNRRIVNLSLDRLPASTLVKEKIREEFHHIYKLYNFKRNYYQLARRWYEDGRLFHHIVIDPSNPKKGIQELRYIDPRQIKKLKGINKVQDPVTNASIVVNVDEFYLYNPVGHISAGAAHTGIPIALDSIAFSHCGVVQNGMLLSHLFKAIRPLNQLKMMEDAVVIYRITRAPERRVFYIDVANLPTNRAERYVRDMMERFKSRLVYNAITGEAGDDRRYMAMQEDFWLPRREGGKGSEITQLEGGKNLSEMQDVEYFLKALYKSLNIPISRLDPNNGFNLGRATEITRDEIDFSKFINMIRDRFSDTFRHPLRAQLILKNITTEKGWNEIEEFIDFEYTSDSYFAQLKKAEVMRDQLDLLEKTEPYIGRYFSQDQVRREILGQSDEDIEEIDARIDLERTSGMFSVRAGKVVSTFPAATPAGAEIPEDAEQSGDSVATRDPSPTKYGTDGQPIKGVGGGKPTNPVDSRRKIRAGVVSQDIGLGKQADPDEERV